MSSVLVTGGTGFLGSHCILKLLDEGHHVRSTVRSAQRGEALRGLVATGGGDPDAVEVCLADLAWDDGWSEAVAGMDYVLHVASPFPPGEPEHADELVVPAREGALRVLRASRDAGVSRVVLTSSFAAVGYGIPQPNRPFDERDWTNPDAPSVRAYMQSKYYAEKAAWDFIDREGGALEMAVINPAGIFGPVLGTDYSTSVGLVRGLLSGALSAVPRLSFGVVDVRDVADLHLRAMAAPEARGERFIAVSGPALSFQEVAMIIRSALGERAAGVPVQIMADDEVRRLAKVSPVMGAMVPQLGVVREASAAKAMLLLGWKPRPAREAIVASAETVLGMENDTEPALSGG